jgi:hypothetical protein
MSGETRGGRDDRRVGFGGVIALCCRRLEMGMSEVRQFYGADDTDLRCRNLGETPGLGVARPDVRTDLRMFPVGNYLILYRPIEAGVEVSPVAYISIGQIRFSINAADGANGPYFDGKTTSVPSGFIRTFVLSALVTIFAPSFFVTTDDPSALVTIFAPSGSVSTDEPSAFLMISVPFAFVVTEEPSAFVTTFVPSDFRGTEEPSLFFMS